MQEPGPAGGVDDEGGGGGGAGELVDGGGGGGVVTVLVGRGGREVGVLRGVDGGVEPGTTEVGALLTGAVVTGAEVTGGRGAADGVPPVADEHAASASPVTVRAAASASRGLLNCRSAGRSSRAGWRV